jgi:hypothetical protein
LYGIRELRVGSSIINWNNNAGGLLHINGYNFEYQYKKISFGTYAGIEMNHLQLSRPFFQRDSIKRRVFGNYIGFELSKKWSSKIYYVFNSNKNPDKSKERKHIAGVEFIQSINKAELNYEFSVSVDNTMSRKMGYFGSTTMNYIKNNSILSIEASYKTLNYFSTNNLVNYSQNLNSNIKFEQRILKNQIQLNASVRFSNNFENDTLFAIKRTSTITGGCYINFKDLPYVQISASHNYILSQEIERLRYPTTQITLNVATGYTWKKKKTSYTVNAYYQFNQCRYVVNLTKNSVPIEVYF